MNKKGFTLVEVIAVVALLAILIGLAGTSFVKKYNESKREAIIIQEGQLVQSGDMVVQDFCKDPLSEGYQLQCDDYFQPYEDSNNNLIIENNTYTKYICVKDLKKLGYYSEELRYSGVDCSGVVVYKIDYETDLQKESYSVIQCGEDYITEVENAPEYLTNFKECFDTLDGGGTTEEIKKYMLTVNFTELTPSGMKVATSHNKEYQKGESISIDVPEYITDSNEYTPFKHGSSQNAGNFTLNTSRDKLTGTMPEGKVVVNIVYSASTYTLTINYKEFNDVQGNITFPSKQYTLYYGESVEIPYENKTNFKIISPANFTFQMEQEDHEIDVIYQQQEFDLTYNSNGGTACDSRKITYNKAYNELCNPIRTGYTFNGWYLNGSQVKSTDINTNYNNITLTAQWTANKYYVIYNCNGGTPTTNYSSEHTYDETSNLMNNQCTKTGSVFGGWKDSNGNTYSNKQSIKNLLSENNSSLTLTAQWSPLIYYVAFAANSGSGTMSKMTVTYGHVVNLTANTFTRTGHRFDGWSGSNGNSYADEASITNLTTTHGATITMTAKWTKCGAGTYLVNNVCTVCAAGTYSAGGVNTCTECPAGKYTNTTGQSACATCNAGTYNTGTGNTSCKSCEAGYYCTGGSHKAACTAGKYSAGGANSCSTCPAGSYCPGTTNKLACTAGTYTNTTGKSSCTTCAAGTYNSGTGNTGCTSCEVGYYCTGGSHKAACTAGTYSAAGASNCTTCPAGSYCPGTTNKLACPVGTYTNTTGKSSCTTCSAGTYNTGTGNTDCTTCEVGYYCTGGSHKAACEAGKYSTGGASSCTTCTAGYYCPGASNRVACSAGKYNNNTGSSAASACSNCSAGYYSDAGASTCTGCPAGKYSTGGASSCTTCTAGYYCPGSSNRIACDDGYTSSAGASSCTASYTVKTGVAGSITGGSNYRNPYSNSYASSGWMSTMKGFVGRNGTYNYSYIVTFKTPGSTNDVTEKLTFKWWVASTGSTISSETYRYAIASSTTNKASYANATGSVSDSYQLVQGTFTWSNIYAASGTANYQTLTINTTALKGGTTYYLYLWPSRQGGVMALQELYYSLSVNYRDY